MTSYYNQILFIIKYFILSWSNTDNMTLQLIAVFSTKKCFALNLDAAK